MPVISEKSSLPQSASVEAEGFCLKELLCILTTVNKHSHVNVEQGKLRGVGSVLSRKQSVMQSEGRSRRSMSSPIFASFSQQIQFPERVKITFLCPDIA